MENPAYARLDLTAAGSLSVGDDIDWIPVRRELGITAFGTNAYVGRAAGDRVIEEHDELGSNAGSHEDLYVVVALHATFTVAGEQLDAPAGVTIFVRDRAVELDPKLVEWIAGDSDLDSICGEEGFPATGPPEP